MVGAVSQHAVRLLSTLILVLVEVTVHVPSLFPGSVVKKEQSGKRARQKASK